MKVVVAGAGLAGMNLALDLARKGHRVSLLESRKSVGGALARRRTPLGMVDNSIHLHIKAFTRCLARLEELGTRDLLVEPPGGMQFQAPNGALIRLSGKPLRDGLRLARHPALWRLVFGTGALLWKLGKQPPPPASTLASWLRELKERPDRPQLELLDEWVLSVFNARSEELDAALVQQTLRAIGAVDGGMQPLVPKAGLDRIWLDPLINQLEIHGVEIHRASSLVGVSQQAGRISGAISSAGKLECDALVYAGNPGGAARAGLAEWISAPPAERGHDIANLIVRLKGQAPTDFFMRGWMGQPFQWAFSAGEGLIALVASCWDQVDDQGEAVKAGLDLLRTDGLEPLAHELIVQRQATRLQSPSFEAWRPANRTTLPGLFCCGAWTRTGLPLSMEGAIVSGKSVILQKGLPD